MVVRNEVQQRLRTQNIGMKESSSAVKINLISELFTLSMPAMITFLDLLLVMSSQLDFPTVKRDVNVCTFLFEREIY